MSYYWAPVFVPAGIAGLTAWAEPNRVRYGNTGVTSNGIFSRAFTKATILGFADFDPAAP